MSRTPDESRPAIVHAETGAEHWRHAARHQLRAPADHADCYALAGEAVTTLHALDDLCRVLAAQVARYGAVSGVYDDTREVRPGERLRQAGDELESARSALAEAARAVNAFWSAIGHIGVEVQP